jgi:hypothetical protein
MTLRRTVTCQMVYAPQTRLTARLTLSTGQVMAPGHTLTTQPIITVRHTQTTRQIISQIRNLIISTQKGITVCYNLLNYTLNIYNNT